jgi:hypothetical protein
MEEYYWSSVEHFNEYKENLSKQTEFDDTEFEEEAEDTADALQSVIESLRNLDPKRKLH